MPLPLLSTKFYIPPARSDAVQRVRLIEKLLASVARPGVLTLLSGPAGFGKTTLLSDFVAHFKRPAAWLSLDSGDNDPIQFWTCLITACQSINAKIGQSILASFHSPQPAPLEAVPGVMINDLARLGGDLVLILDDYHAVQNEAIHAGLSFVLEHQSGNLHLIVATRTDPPWPLARLRARNQLVEVRAQELRFTPDEAAIFLMQMTGITLSSTDIAALDERTEGWIAGLQLAAISMKGRSDISGFIKAFSGSHLYIAEYLVEEVLHRQPEEIQTFLLKTSILDSMNSELCEAVTGGAGGQSVLMALSRANLFIIPLDDEGRWFRYHHLFADLLQARLRMAFSEAAIRDLHLRAAAWYEQADMISDAIEQARRAALNSKDYSSVLRLVQKVSLPVILQGHVKTVEGWLRIIPEEYVEQNPRIIMSFAWLYLLTGAFVQAEPYFNRLSAFFSKEVDVDPALQVEWLALQSKLANLQGRPAESRDLANQALEILPRPDAPVRSMLYTNLATAYSLMLDYDRAIETFQQIIRDAQVAGDPMTEILGISGQAQMLLQRGSLHLALQTASEGLKRLESLGKPTPFSATLFGEIGVVYYHWRQLDQAQNYLLKSMQTSGQSGYSDPEIYYHFMLSRMAQMEGDWNQADQEMQAANELARKIPPAMIREGIIYQQVRVDLAIGRVDTAQELLRREGFSFEDEFVYPELKPPAGERVRPITEAVGMLYNSALRVLLSQARLEDNRTNLKPGIELAGILFAGELKCHQHTAALETLLLRAQLYKELGDEKECLEDVAKAIELAEPEGFISIFLEEGPEMAGLIARLSGPDQAGRLPQSYIQSILSAFPQARNLPTGLHHSRAPHAVKAMVKPGESMIEPLTNREMEVLQLITAGYSNQAIAEKLVITVSAVKKHANNIYGKLGVNSRTQAVASARQLGLIAPD